MMAKEDSEKTNLLHGAQEKKEDKKRKQYSVPKSPKEASDSKKRWLNWKTFGSKAAVQGESRPSTPVSIEAPRAEPIKKMQRNKSPDDDDTCSCVSCALKRIVGSECVCIICLLLFFLISMMVACILVFKGGSTLFDSTEIPQMSKTYSIGMSGDSERLKRKIDLLTEDTLNRGVRERRKFEDYDSNILSVNLDDSPTVSDLDFGQSVNKYGNVDDSGDMELTNFLEPEKLDLQDNERLREFYKKLVHTDAEIKRLKKSRSHASSLYNSYYETKSPERTRRSLKLYKPRANVSNKNNNAPHLRRPKRFVNDTNDATGFIIENQKVFIQYKPIGKKKVPKCSHVPKQPNEPQHEHQLKHPFYQNSQRLDELLDKFFNRNLPDFMSDDNTWDTLFQAYKKKCKHPKVEHSNDSIIINRKTKKGNWTYLTDKDKNTGNNASKQNDFPMTTSKRHQKHWFSSNPMHEKSDLHTSDINTLLLSASEETHSDKKFLQDANLGNEYPVTDNIKDLNIFVPASNYIMSIPNQTDKLTTYYIMDRVPQIRRLMQVDGEEEENLGYEDIKEVLTDDMDNQDDAERRGDRSKRNQEMNTNAADNTQNMFPLTKVIKFSPPGVHNPNWKGPMPLYPDELNSMLQDTTNINKASQRSLKCKGMNKIRKGKDDSELKFSEYYLDNDNAKSAKVEQAYSDYGVLDERKANVKNEENQATENIFFRNTVKSTAISQFVKRGPLRRHTIDQNVATRVRHKSVIQSSPDGFRIEMRPTTADRTDNFDVKNFFRHHFKLAKSSVRPKEKFTFATDRAYKRERPANFYACKSKGRNLLSTQMKRSDHLFDNKNLEDSHEKNIVMPVKSNNEGNCRRSISENELKHSIYDVNKYQNIKYIYKRDSNESKTPTTNIIRNLNENDLSVTISSTALHRLASTKRQVNVSSESPNKQSTTEAHEHNVNETANNFFKIISNLFRSQQRYNMGTSTTGTHLSLNILELLTPDGDSTNTSKQNNISTITDRVHPLSNLIDVHKSRVLMSINEDNGDSAINGDEKSSKEGTAVTEVMYKNVSESNLTSTAVSNVNQNNKTFPQIGQKVILDLQSKRETNSRKVKRDVDDSNLIFWGNIYDDEYGIQTDNLDGVITDKHPKKKHSNFIKRSGKWMQEKVMKFANNLKGHDSEAMERKRSPRPAARYKKSVVSKFLKRGSDLENADYDLDQKAVFKALKSNLGQVCKEAAAAVKRIRNADVTEESQHSSKTTTLMQQLVGVLTELIDHQVQQKTGSVLPPDLRRFLNWLTLPQSEAEQQRDLESVGSDNPLPYIENYWDDAADKISRKVEFKYDSILPNDISDEELSPSDTLESVIDLLRQYELMSDDDKSKMTGIKHYLQNQMEYLKKESGQNLYDAYGKGNQYFRYKRNRLLNDYNIPKRRIRRTANKFIKHFGKKYTRSTAGYSDAIVVMEKKKMKDIHLAEHSEDNSSRINSQDTVRKDVKRNLQDVYYQAVDQAKKCTKQSLKKGDIADFSTTQNVKLVDMSKLPTEKSSTVKCN